VLLPAAQKDETHAKETLQMDTLIMVGKIVGAFLIALLVAALVGYLAGKKLERESEKKNSRNWDM
jgi:uncharacterized oligopeptide transporter (OPT) family protein